MFISFLRGGGCAATKVPKNNKSNNKQEMERGQQKVQLTNKEKMAKLIQQHSEIIAKNAIIALSEKKKLQSSFQFFLDNQQELWELIVNKDEGNQILDVILINIKPLLDALQILIKGFIEHSVYLSQIISLLSWIVFCFYINIGKTDRFMPKKDQRKYLDAINQIKSEIDIEKNIDKYQNNLEYDLYIIESIFTILPTDGDELQEIAKQFFVGAATSFLSFSIDREFLESLKNGVIYIYNEHDKASRKKILKIIFGLLQLKYEIVSIIQGTYKNEQKDTYAYLDQLSNVYKEIVSKSSDWQIWCTWTKVLSQLFQQKLILPSSKIQSLKISDQPFIHNNANTCWLNIDSRLIESNATAKLLFENIAELQELGRLQYSILYGYQQMPSFEYLYSSKLTQAIEKENQDAFSFNLSTVSIMQHNAQEIQKAQQQLQQHIQLLSKTNKSKIQDINNNLSKAITNTIQLLEFIYSLHEIENPNENELESPKQIISKKDQPKQQPPEEIQQESDNKEKRWFEEIYKLKKSYIKTFVSFFLKKLIYCQRENNQIDVKIKEEFQRDFLFKQEIYQDSILQDINFQLNILQLLKDVKDKKKKYKKKSTRTEFEILVNKFEDDAFELINLQDLQTSLKYIRIRNSKYQMNNDKDYYYGFKEGQNLLQGGSAFLRWNLRLLIKMKYYIQELDQYNEKSPTLQTDQIINSLQIFSTQLSSIKSIQKCIKFFYSKFEACIKFKVIGNGQRKRNVIYQIAKNITLKKFETLNMVYQIHKETIRKVKNEGVIYICQSMFQAIQNDHDKFLDDLIQIKRAIQMVIDILKANKSNKQLGDELELFKDNNKIQEQNIDYPDNHAKWLKNKEKLFQITSYYQNYQTSFKSWQQKNQNLQQSNIWKDIEKKQKLIKDYIYKIELAQQYKTIQEDDDNVKKELYGQVNQHFLELLSLNIQNEKGIQEIEGNGNNKIDETTKFFEELFEKIKEIEHQVQIQFDNLKFINQQQGIFYGLINNSQLLKRANSQFQKKIDQNEEKIKELIGIYEEKLPNEIYDFGKLKDIFNNYKLVLNANLKSEIFFILTQIWKKEDVTSDPNYYDQFKEAASDLINQNKWRIRQSCIFEMLQFKTSCLTQATSDLARGLIVKFQIYETDRRNKQLLDDQDQNQVTNMFQQYWASQEEDVQSKIKQKLEELNDIAYKITIETKQYEKLKFKKRYAELEREIQGIVKNAESLGNSLGTSLLFFQDIKSDLVNIQSQLKSLQGSIDQIQKDIQQLQGRTIKDLLIIRMQRILQQRIILNSESVYIPIKTKEKQVSENLEDEETPLYTDDLFSNGEINEFIWKQQKLSLLIHGQAGSGKSTAARKIEEFLWLLFKKNMNIAESIPIIPIFISLPQLKDPISMAMEETLKSDNYRFNDKQIIEFKEAVEQNQFKLVIIMDSYDEIKSEFTNRNLILSNKLYKWRCQSDNLRFPKIITTSRSEMFVNTDYRQWFLPESENLQFYKEIRLLNFTNQQVNTYIEYHVILSVKKIIKDFFFNNKDNNGFFAFEELFNEVNKVINDQEQQSDSQDQIFLLSKNQIEKILSLCESFASGDIALTMQQSLEEIKSKEFYFKNIKQMDITSLLETPFMIEIVASVLPQMIKHRQELSTLKESFHKKLFQQQKYNQEDVQKEWTKIVSHEKFLEDYVKEPNDIEREKVLLNYFGQQDDFTILQNALQLDPLCSYDFYEQFFGQFFKRQISKLKESGESLAYISNLADIWEFTHRLANDMTISQLSQVQYTPRILLFQKNKDADWRDVYFNDELEQGQIKKLFRKIMPIRQKYGIYSFNHKSLQEFLVAKWLINSLDQFNQDLYPKKVQDFTVKQIKDLNTQLDDLCVHNLSKDYMNGIVKFMIEKLSNNQFLQQKLFEIINLSKIISLSTIIPKKDFIGEDDKLKMSQSIKIKRSQTQVFASQNIQENLYSVEENAQRIIQASSNSLYLLHKLKYQFQQDLSDIVINDVELIDANLVNVKLSKSNFSKVNISQCNFNFADLSNVKWNQILIDELPSFQVEHEDDDYKELDVNKLCFFHYYKPQEQIVLMIKISPKKQNQDKNLILWYDYKNQTLNKNNDQDEIFNPNLNQMFVSKNQQKYAFFYQNSKNFIQIKNSKIELDPKFICQIANFTNKDDELLVVSDQNQIKRIKIDSNDKDNLIIDNQNIIQNTAPDEINQIASNQIYFIFLSKEKVFFVKNERIYKFYYKCSHNKCEEIRKQNRFSECLEIVKYTLIEVSQNQNILVLGFLAKFNKCQFLLIEELQVEEEKNLITNGKFKLFELKGEELKVQFVDDDKYIVTFSTYNNVTTMSLWNYKEKQLLSFNLLDDRIKSITKITELLIATISVQQKKIQIWDLQVLLKQQNSSSLSTITSCIFSNNKNIISGDNNGIIQIWDTEKGMKIGKDLQHNNASVTALRTFTRKIYKKTQQILLSGDSKGYINEWDIIKQQFLQSINIISPIKSLEIIKNSEDNIQLFTHSQQNHYLQLWSKDYQSYQLFSKSDKDQKNLHQIEQTNITSTIIFLKDKQISPKKCDGLQASINCTAFTIGKYTNDLYFAGYKLQQNMESQSYNNLFINVYREEFDQQTSKFQVKFRGTIQLNDNQSDKVTSIIKEINSQRLFAITEQSVYIIKIQNLTIEKRFYYDKIGKILDIQIDEDLLFICGKSVEIQNIRTEKQIPINQQQIEGEQFCKLAYYRFKNILFIGTTSGKLILYDLLCCNSKVHYQYQKDEIIYLQIHKKQVQTGQEDVLVSAGKNSLIHFWSLSDQDLQQLKVLESKNILENQEINRLWYFDQQNFIIFQNQNGFFIADYNNLKYYAIAKYHPQILCDYNYSQQVFYQYDDKTPILTKTRVLQEAHKTYFQENSSYKAEYMLRDHKNNQIITSDGDAQIIFWKIGGDYEIYQIEPFKIKKPQQVSISLSENDQKLICGCYCQEDEQFQFSLISLESHKTDLINLNNESQDLLQGNKLIQLQLLHPNLLLILTDNNINICFIDKEQILQQIKDPSGKSKGLAVLQNEVQNKEQNKEQKEVFITYGEFNQLTYYQSFGENDQFASKFRFGSAMKKFSCEYANIKNSQFTSKHGINLKKIFEQKNNFY
ncbi:unnamed protein product [Paramecium sonneborni]|uniref:NACHT domain-containing protein n=1 Tax=Paramecium sonneborni TaxID=65129 RepID=A0A8S1R9V7_9CILI|nr:unnamed protein product [Paramecium sonneborni]